MDQHQNNDDSTLIVFGKRSDAVDQILSETTVPLEGARKVTTNPNYARAIGFELTEDTVKFFREAEEKKHKYKRVAFAGAILDYSSESNIRYLLAAAFLCARTEVIIIETHDNLQNRWNAMRRSMAALDISLPSFKKLGQNYVCLTFNVSAEKGKYMSLHERDSLQAALLNRSLSAADVLSQAEQAAADKRGFSFIRINHCENRLFGYNYSFGSSDTKETYAIQFGYDLNRENTHQVSQRIITAVRNADVLGVPTFRGFSSAKLRILENSTFVHLRDFSLLNKKRYTDVNIHIKHFFKNEFRDFLRKFDRLSIIGSRDVARIFEGCVGVPVKQFFIPTEFKFKTSEDVQKHFPDAYSVLTQRLASEVRPGDVFLIGAGILGKIYCDVVRSSGGVAIDVGSFLDAAVGMNTRGTGFPAIEWISHTDRAV